MRLAIAVLALALLAPAPSLAITDASGSTSDPAAHDVAKKKRKKPKAVKCKPGQVRVKVGKRIRCQSVSAALPRPKEAGQRLLILQSALGADWSGLRDRRGRRAPSMAKVFRRVSPAAHRAAQRAVPRALALQDRAAGRAAKAPCARDVKQPGKDSASFSEKSGGLSLEAKVSLDAIELSLENKDKRIEVSFDLCKIREQVDVPECPTSKGVVDATQIMNARVTIVLFEDGKVAQSFTSSIDGTTKLHGEVGDDAKLNHIDIDDTQTLAQSSPRQGILIGAASVSGRFVRNTRVDMRSRPERYQPQETEVSMNASLGGLAGFLVGSEFRQNATRRLKQASDKLFADTVAKAIETYRARETGWNQPGKCAELRFEPASDTLRLRLGDTGQLGGRIVSKRDGGDPGFGRWTLTSQANGAFNPASADGGNPQFGYGVTNAGTGVFVTAAFHAVSKAGVADGTWRQPTQALRVERIAGGFSGTYDVSGSVLTWQGGATYRRAGGQDPGVAGLYTLQSGTATVVASGKFFAEDCQQSGTKVFTLGGDLMGDIFVSGTPPLGFEPYSYSISAIFPPPSSMDVTLSSCSDSSHNGNVATIGVGVSAIDGQGMHVSPDGIVYDGAATQSFGVVSGTWSWSLRGSE